MEEKNTDFLAAREEVVKKVLEQQPDDEILYDLAELFKIEQTYEIYKRKVRELK